MDRSARIARLCKVLPILVLVLLCLPPLLLDSDAYALRVATLVIMFAGMATAWNIVGGEANLISLGHAAFFGIGAYCSSLLLMHYQWSPWLGMVVAMGAAGVASLIIGVPTFRLRGHYFALGTIAFTELVRVLVLYFSGLTGGAVGISVPAVEDGWLYMQFAGNREFYVIAFAMYLVVLAIAWSIHKRPLGYRLRALRSSHEAAEVAGVDTLRTKLVANFISCGLIGAFGVFYAQMHFFIDPETVFSFWSISIKIAMMAILGGLTYVWGPLAGAVVLVILDEWTTAVFSSEYAGAGQLIYGVLLIVLVLWRPKGILELGEKWLNRYTRRA